MVKKSVQGMEERVALMIAFEYWIMSIMYIWNMIPLHIVI